MMTDIASADSLSRAGASRTGGDVATATATVAAAAAAGSLATDTAARLVGILDAHRRAIETADLERRLEALEARR